MGMNSRSGSWDLGGAGRPDGASSRFIVLRVLLGNQRINSKCEKGNTMEEEKKEVQPIIGEYQGKPIIRIPTVDNPIPDITWNWMSFGKNKAKAIVKYYDAIKKFAEE
jgi:hypothetical protein